jgi:hypothetical protein
MPLDEVQKKTLFDSLQERGWHWREDFLYAPNESMWLLKSQPWIEDLQNFHERMIGRLERIQRNRNTHKTEAEYKNVFNDTAGLIEVLKKMVDDEASAAA